MFIVMLIVRVLGGLLVAASLVIFGSDLLRSIERSEVDLITVGGLWFQISPTGINLVQAIVERFVHPLLWDPMIVFILQLPAGVLLLAFGGLLMAGTRWRAGAVETKKRAQISRRLN